MSLRELVHGSTASAKVTSETYRRPGVQPASMQPSAADLALQAIQEAKWRMAAEGRSST